MKFYHHKKGMGAKKAVAMLNGGHNKFWGSLYAVARRFGHIEGRGDTKSFHS